MSRQHAQKKHDNITQTKTKQNSTTYNKNAILAAVSLVKEKNDILIFLIYLPYKSYWQHSTYRVITSVDRAMMRRDLNGRVIRASIVMSGASGL